VYAFQLSTDGDCDGSGRGADITKSQLRVVGDVVINREGVARAEGVGGQSHHLGEICPSGAIVIGHAQGSDDGDITRRGNLDRTSVEI